MVEKELEGQTAEFKKLYPGTNVPLEDGSSATVFPMGFLHISKFSKELTFALTTLSRVAIPVDATAEQKTAAIAAQMVPYIANNLLDLVSDCTKFSNPERGFENLAHWEVPEIIEAWIEESFGSEKKWKPWVATVERILNRFLNPKEPIRILETLSSGLSSADTQSTKSSTNETTTSRTPVGASPNSSSS